MSTDLEESAYSFSNNKPDLKKILTTSLKLLPVFLILLGLAASTYNLRFKKNYRPEASSIIQAPDKLDRIKVLNSELSSHSQSIRGQAVNQQTTDNLRFKAVERKSIMLSFLPNEPEKFLENVLPEETKNKLPSDLITQGLIEEKKEHKGKLEMLVEDDLKNQKANYKYKLNDNNLHLSSKLEPLRGSGEVSLIAYSLDNNLILADQPNNVQYSSLINYQILGPQKVLMVIISADFDPAFLTQQTVQDRVFGPTNSTVNYYAETSRNKMGIIGDVAPVINLTNVASPCSYTHISDLANSELQNQGYNLADYRIIQYYIPAEGCNYPFNGIAYVGGQFSLVVGNDWFYLDTTDHEMGHNFGLLHANRYECPGVSIGDKSICHDFEYGDMFDEMGGQYDGYPQFNAPHKLALGWFSDSEYLNVTRDQQVNLYAHESTLPGVKIARIWRNIEDEFLYLSFRQKVGFDSLLPNTLIQGTNMHLTGANYDSVKTLFIDAHPDTLSGGTDFYDAGIFDNQIFTDTASGIQIKQISHTVTGSVIDINIPDNYPPQLKFANFNGLYRLQDGSLKANLNTTVSSFVQGTDYSDSVSVNREIKYPDGSSNNITMNVAEIADSKLCQEIKCFQATGGEFVTNQEGYYTLTFTGTDSQGAVSNSLIYEFSVGTVMTPTIVLSGTISPTPTNPIKITPTPTPAGPSPTRTRTPTPTIHSTFTPTPTPGLWTVSPVADAFVNSNFPTNNLGKDSDIKVKSSPTKIGFMKFNVSHLGSAKFTSARLKLWINDPTNTNIYVYNVTDNSWTETGINYNNRPVLGSQITSFTANQSGVYKEIDLSFLIKLNLPKEFTLGFAITGTNEFSFKSRNSADISRRPVLIIQ